MECIKKKIAGVVIISSGFSEIGEKGKELELEKLKKSIRILGPNCIGTFVPNVMDMMFLDRKRLKRPPDGSTGLITQSGAVGSALIDLASNEGIGISKFASIGNKVDIDEVELLEYFNKDVQTRCIALYIESIKRGKDFINVCKKITKPIVVFKAGKTQKGNEAVLSHTGAMAGSGEVYSSAFKQAGIIEAESVEDIFDFSKILSSQPNLKDGKIAIITNGGGFGVIATDYAIKNGLEIVKLSKETESSLKKFLPKYATTNNPVDLTGDANSERYRRAIEAVMKDKEVSGVICIALFQIPTLEDDIIDVLGDSKIHGKPIVVCATGGAYTMERVKKLEKMGIPVYATPERAVRAMKILYEHGKISKK
jgi:acyl-CoA synthetase (NDP forming)